jgi:HD superfamily phosphodiesterase
MLLDEMKNYVYQETQKNNNALGPSFYQEHLDVVSTYGKKLAKQLNANMEIVELSAYLHDISAVQDFSTLQIRDRIPPLM